MHARPVVVVPECRIVEVVVVWWQAGMARRGSAARGARVGGAVMARRSREAGGGGNGEAKSVRGAVLCLAGDLSHILERQSNENSRWQASRNAESRNAAVQVLCEAYMSQRANVRGERGVKRCKSMAGIW